MRLPRIATRRLMVLVAVFAVLMGWTIERRSRFRSLAAHHVGEGLAHPPKNAGYPPPSVALPHRASYQMWRFTLAAKYHRAARDPWLPVPPDPSMPE